MATRVTPMTPSLAAPARTALAIGWPLLNLIKKIIFNHASAAPDRRPAAQRPFDRATATRDGTAPTSGTAPVSEALDAGQARVILGVHCADEYGMCTGCAYMAHFCWAPCSQARQAMSVLDTASVTQFGAP